MRFKKLLAAGLVLAMSLTVTAGLAACGDQTTPSGDDNTDPPEHVHTFDTTKWENNETSHWHPATCEHTDQKGNAARHDFSGRECTVCHYTKEAEVYIEGLIASHPTNRWYNAFTLAGGSITQVRTDCIKMTASEDKQTYTAEVYLTPQDRFAVYEYSAGKEYPSAAATMSASNALRVEESNTYLITWVLDSDTPTVRVHDHKFTKYVAQGAQHYLKCTDDDTIKADSYESHTFEGDACSKCGAEKTCEHSNGSIFQYTDKTLPAAVDNGGTLKKYCPDCGNEVTEDSVSYTKGTNENHSGVGDRRITVSVNDVVYATKGQQSVSLTVSAAGTYTFTLSEVYKSAGFEFCLSNIYVTNSSGAERGIVSGGVWVTTGRPATETTKWRASNKLTFDGGEPQDGTKNYTPFKSITFKVEETDLHNGSFTMSIVVDTYATSSGSTPINYPQMALLIAVTKDE